jgi:hypothetical protein
MNPSIVLSTLSVSVGIVLGAIALGIVGGPPAVLGFLAVVFIAVGLLMPNVFPERQAPVDVTDAEVVD